MVTKSFNRNVKTIKSKRSSDESFLIYPKYPLNQEEVELYNCKGYWFEE
jgi:hypothetical protein